MIKKEPHIDRVLLGLVIASMTGAVVIHMLETSYSSLSCIENLPPPACFLVVLGFLVQVGVLCGVVVGIFAGLWWAKDKLANLTHKIES